MVISSTHFLQTSYKFCLNGHQQATTMSPSPLPHTSSLWAAHHLWLPSAALLNFIFPLDLCWLSLLHIWKLIHVTWSNKLLVAWHKCQDFMGVSGNARFKISSHHYFSLLLYFFIFYINNFFQIEEKNLKSTFYPSIWL